MTLYSKYQDVLKRMQQYEQHHQDNDDCWHENDDSYSDKSAAMYLISQQRAREALIEELEIKNAEMQKMLDNALHKSTEIRHNNEKTTRKLQDEIDILRSNLDSAAQKIQQLEELRLTEKYKGQRCNDNTDALSCNMQDQLGTEDLSAKMIEMQTKNEQLTTAKQFVEDKLQRALMDLQNLSQQLAQFQYDQQEYISLKEAYQRQFKHIEELTINLEDHRNTLSYLRDCGIGWSPRHSPATSEHGRCYITERHGPSTDSTSNNPPAFNSNLRMDLCMTTPKQSLLYELENEWIKRLQKPALSESLPDYDTNISNTDTESHSSYENDNKSNASHTKSIAPLKQIACLTERNLATLYNASAEHAPEILSCAAFKERIIQHISPAISMTQTDIEVPSIRRDSIMHSTHDLYPHVPPDFLVSFDCRHSNHGIKCNRHIGSSLQDQHPCTVFGLICWVLQCSFLTLWRWCRFSLVLFTAVIINLWQGPDAILEK